MSQFLRCPACNEVIPFGDRHCKYCAAELSYEEAQKAAAQFAQLSEACALANNLNTFTPLAPILLAAYGFITVTGWARDSQRFIVYGLPLAPLLTVFYWHLTYKHIQSDDPDFQKAQRDVKKSLYVWLPTTIVLVVFLIIWHLR